MSQREDNGLFDARVAPFYDATLGVHGTPESINPMVEFLLEQARGGRALEFAIGTGRVALPLAERGVEVHGIELSRAMVNELLRKPGGDAVPVVIGDMATSVVPGSFSLVYLVFNTIGNLLSQAQQVECFRNAARHLARGGRFVIEMLVPELHKLPHGERFVAFDVSDRHYGIDEYDVVNQRLTSHHVWFDGDRTTRFDAPMRYAFPAELDLMAELAGLTRIERWSDWKRAPFTAHSGTHISVWEQASRA